MSRIIVGILSLLVVFSCKDNEAHLDINKFHSQDDIYMEPFRPQFHFSPKSKWMNDPNGLVYHKGNYHLFYQFYPDSTVWGPMHWGHAVSKDLLYWKHKPIALYPDSLGYIFSGSAVVDKNNSSGFGSKDNPPLVAIFTYHLIEGERSGRDDFQYQGIAYSLDEGESWTKYENNPVIGNPTSIRDFRDPKVFWHDESGKWIMVLVAGDHAKFYSSSNLKEWEPISEFGKMFGAHGGVWECPDLFKLKVEGSSEEKWVLLISLNPGAPNGGSGTQYFIGNFDGKSFTPDHLDIRWLDYGTDNYAGITYNNTKDENRTFIGWMSNWNYAQQTPTEEWRSAMTVPRRLSLYKQDKEIKLKNYPIDNFEDLYTDDDIDVPSTYNNPILLNTNKRSGADIRFMANLSKPFQLRLSNKRSEALSLNVDPDKKMISLDRSRSGKIEFGKAFADKKHTLPYLPKDEKVEFRIILDASSVEVFVEKGKYVFTSQVFPVNTYSVLNINAVDEESISDLKINLVKSIWVDEE